MKELKSYKGLTGRQYALRTQKQKTKVIWILNGIKYNEEQYVSRALIMKIAESRIDKVIKENNNRVVYLVN